MKKLLLGVSFIFALHGVKAQSNTYYINGLGLGYYNADKKIKINTNPLIQKKLIGFYKIGLEHKLMLKERWNICLGINFGVNAFFLNHGFGSEHINDSIVNEYLSRELFIAFSFNLNQGVEYKLLKLRNMCFFVGCEINVYSAFSRQSELGLYSRMSRIEYNGYSINIYKSFLFPSITLSMKLNQKKIGNTILKAGIETGGFIEDRSFFSTNAPEKLLIGKTMDNRNYFNQVYFSLLMSLDSFKPTDKKKK